MSQSGLIVRRSVRHEVVLPARFRVAPEYADAVRFARGVTDEHGWVGVHLVDYAHGGAGFVSELFLPRGVTVELQILDANSPIPRPLLHVRCRVMRVQMTDRRPAYLIGVAFVEPDDATQTAIDALLDQLDGIND